MFGRENFVDFETFCRTNSVVERFVDFLFRILSLSNGKTSSKGNFRQIFVKKRFDERFNGIVDFDSRFFSSFDVAIGSFEHDENLSKQIFVDQRTIRFVFTNDSTSSHRNRYGRRLRFDFDFSIYSNDKIKRKEKTKIERRKFGVYSIFEIVDRRKSKFNDEISTSVERRTSSSLEKNSKLVDFLSISNGIRFTSSTIRTKFSCRRSTRIDRRNSSSCRFSNVNSRRISMFRIDSSIVQTFSEKNGHDRHDRFAHFRFSTSKFSSSSLTFFSTFLCHFVQFTPEMFDGLVVEKQNQFIDETFSLWSRSKSSILTSAIQMAISKVRRFCFRFRK
jgi:hypothetical protein